MAAMHVLSRHLKAQHITQDKPVQIKAQRTKIIMRNVCTSRCGSSAGKRAAKEQLLLAM